MRHLATARAFTVVVFQHLVKDRAALFLMIVLPVIVIVVIGVTFGGESRVALGYVQLGHGPLSERVALALAGSEGLDVKRYERLDELQAAVRRQQIAVGLVVSAGFDDAIAAGGAGEIGIVALPASEIAFTGRAAADGVLASVGSRLGAARFATASAGGSFDENLALAERLAGPPATLTVWEVGEREVGELSRFSLVAPQQLVLFVFVNAMATAGLIVRARRFGVLRRALATPTGAGTVLVGLGTGWLALALFQSAVIVLVGSLLFGVSWGSPLAATLLVFAFALVGCGAGLLVGAVGRDEDRVGTVTPILGIVLGALGGCMAPLEIFPLSMLAIARLTPHYWAVTAWQALVLEDAGALEILPSLVMLLAFAGAFLLAAALLLHRDLTMRTGLSLALRR